MIRTRALGLALLGPSDALRVQVEFPFQRRPKAAVQVREPVYTTHAVQLLHTGRRAHPHSTHLLFVSGRHARSCLTCTEIAVRAGRTASRSRARRTLRHESTRGADMLTYSEICCRRRSCGGRASLTPTKTIGIWQSPSRHGPSARRVALSCAQHACSAARSLPGVGAAGNGAGRHSAALIRSRARRRTTCLLAKGSRAPPRSCVQYRGLARGGTRALGCSDPRIPPCSARAPFTWKSSARTPTSSTSPRRHRPPKRSRRLRPRPTTRQRRAQSEGERATRRARRRPAWCDADGKLLWLR